MIQIKNFINGQFTSGSGKAKAVYSPWDGKVLGQFQASTPEDLQKAIAKIGQAQKEWAQVTMKKRAQIFYKYRTLVKKNWQELIKINSLENGKLEVEAAGGWNKALEIIEYAASMPNLIKTRIINDVSTGIDAYEDRRPVGIVASITPFNFPAMVPHWTIPITLMAGNALILKPSSLTPITAQKIAEMLQEAGLPAGLFNVLCGGKEIVEAILEHPAVSAITFVGSSPVAKLVYQRGTHHFKKVLALGEAKNHILVTTDTDPQIVADNVIASAFGMAGQRCMAASVVVAIEDFHFQKEIVATLKKKVMGKDYGAIISNENLQKINAYIADAQKAGAKILVDGRQVPKYNKSGYWTGLTVVDWENQRHKMQPFEVFGPVLEVVRAKNIHDAIAFQNKSPYGNGASIFTQNGRFAKLATKGLTAGMIGVNIGVPVPREPLAFAGVKESLFGHGGITADRLLDFVTTEIKITEKWNRNPQEDWMG